MNRRVSNQSNLGKASAFGIGVEHAKSGINIGTLLRSAVNFGASFVFTVGRRYSKQASDTIEATRRIPVFHYQTWAAYRESAPFAWIPIAVELTDDAGCLTKFIHPKQCVYLLGPEDGSIGKEAMEMCKYVVQIPSKGCLNVAVAGSIVMYDRICKESVLTTPENKE